MVVHADVLRCGGSCADLHIPRIFGHHAIIAFRFEILLVNKELIVGQLEYLSARPRRAQPGLNIGRVILIGPEPPVDFCARYEPELALDSTATVLSTFLSRLLQLHYIYSYRCL